MLAKVNRRSFAEGSFFRSHYSALQLEGVQLVERAGIDAPMERPIRLLIRTRIGPDFKVLRFCDQSLKAFLVRVEKARYIHQLCKFLHQGRLLRRRVGHGLVVALMECVPVKGIDLIRRIDVFFQGSAFVLVLGWTFYFGGSLGLLAGGGTLVIAQVDRLGGRVGCAWWMGDMLVGLGLRGGIIGWVWHAGRGREDIWWR